jgi:hypothetical protein
MTDTPLKSCYSCEHCDDSDDFAPTCKKYTFTVDNYLHGTSTKNEYWCLTARENKKLCGPDAVGHEPRLPKPEVDAQEPLLVDIAKTAWAFIRPFIKSMRSND